ncbi:MAG: FtsQ-type POTRA domain-containing protein [Akkermansiaceae bacterium]|nr:FtsQ-type POTRA domain-containing protein [Akkermansiaceae bacterium]
MKRKTTKHRRHARQSVLEVRVMSPRIAWFGFLKVLGRFTKLAAVLAVLTAIGWGVWRGIEHAFYKNPDFRLQVLDLNPNPVIDELRVASVAGIDLTANPSMFEIDVSDMTEKLRKLPEVTEARVERHLPSTLVVRIIPRSPKAWVTCPAAGMTETRKVGALLVDYHGFAYPCPELQLADAQKLPIIELPASEEFPIRPAARIKQRELDQCFLLLDSARAADPEAIHWIETIRPANDWSLEIITRHGTRATFGLDDHSRQMASLRAALDHSSEKGYVIDTINLIPKYNIPVTVRDGAPPVAVPTPAAEPAPPTGNRRARDLNNLLNRN